MRRRTGSKPSAIASLACVLSLALASPSRALEPLASGETRPVPLTLAAASQAERADLSRAIQDAPQAVPAEAPSKPFFKTRRGVITAVLMVAGLGWVIYSKSNEGVTSPAND